MRFFLCLALALTACARPRPTPAKETPQAEPSADDVYFCRYEGKRSALANGALSIGARDTPFAHVIDAQPAPLTLTVPWGSPLKATRLDLTAQGVSLSRISYAPDRPLAVHATRPLPLGVVELNRHAKVEFLGTTEDRRMLAEALLPGEYRSIKPMRLKLRCDETSLVLGTQDHPNIPSDFSDGGVSERITLELGQDIPVSATAGGAPEGILRIEASRAQRWQPVTVIGEQGDSVHIERQFRTGVVRGWVPRSALVRRSEPKPEAPQPPRPLAASTATGCNLAAPLYVARDGQQHRVGALTAAASFEVVKTAPGWVEVALPELQWIRLEPGSSWAVAADDFKPCKPKE